MEAIRNATGHKLQREKAYVLQLLSLPHMQVSGGGRDEGRYGSLVNGWVGGVKKGLLL